MATETITSMFRSVSELTTSDYSDGNMNDYAIPYALSFINEVLDPETDYEIVSDTTGNALVDQATAFFATAYAYRTMFFDKVYKRGDETEVFYWEYFEQFGFSILHVLNNTKVIFDDKAHLFMVPNGKTTFFTITRYSNKDKDTYTDDSTG